MSPFSRRRKTHYANANAGDYATEQELVDSKYIRQLSSKNDICVATATGPQVPATNKDYVVVGQGVACASGSAK